MFLCLIRSLSSGDKASNLISGAGGGCTVIGIGVGLLVLRGVQSVETRLEESLLDFFFRVVVLFKLLNLFKIGVVGLNSVRVPRWPRDPSDIFLLPNAGAK